MKEKILAAIKAKFPDVKLSQSRLDWIAARIEPKLDNDETKIEANLDTFNDIYPFTELAKDDNNRSALEGKLKATQKKTEKSTETTVENAEDDDTPKWAKSLVESNKALSEKIAKLEGEKTASTIRTKASGMLKDVPEKFWSKLTLPESEDKLAEFVESVKTDWTEFSNELTVKGISMIPAPGGNNNPPPKKEAISAEVKDFVEKNLVETK